MQRAWTEAAARITRIPSGVSVTAGTLGGLPCDRIEADGADRSRAILYLHGGAYVLGSRRTHRGLAAQIALAGKAPVHLLEYRLGPEHKHPAGIEDSVSAYRELISSGIEPKAIVVVGDSAGGGLAVAMAMRLREEGEPLPGGLVLLNAWLDLTCSGASMYANARHDVGLFRDWTVRGGELYRGDADPLDPELSPVAADLRGLPPIYLQVGTHDLLLSDSETFADRARAAGVDVRMTRFERMWHDFQLAAGLLREADEAMADLAVALDDIWAGRPLAERAADVSGNGSVNGRPAPSVAIIGAGFGGIGLAITLKKAGNRLTDDLREGRGSRRCLAAQHLSGRGVRRALAPLLVFVRAESRLEPPLLAAAGDPRLPGALRGEVRPAPGPSPGDRGDPGGVRR